MTREDLNNLSKKLIEKALAISQSKGREYAGNENDALGNFKRGAVNVGVNPETVLFIYLSKHIDSLNTFVKDLEGVKDLALVEGKLSEPIAGRIIDVINYCLLLNGLLEERRALRRDKGMEDFVRLGVNADGTSVPKLKARIRAVDCKRKE
jgi:hypothetical protein